VSGKTSFLVVGDQCSRRKYEKVRLQQLLVTLSSHITNIKPL